MYALMLHFLLASRTPLGYFICQLMCLAWATTPYATIASIFLPPSSSMLVSVNPNPKPQTPNLRTRKTKTPTLIPKTPTLELKTKTPTLKD